MFDNPESFLKIFGILIAVAYLIFRLQLIGTIIEGYRNWKNRKGKYEADKRKYSKFQNDLDAVINKKEDYFSVNTELNFSLLNIEHFGNHYKIYFMIDGGTILIKDINSDDFKLLSIEPSGYIPYNSTGAFSFKKINPDKQYFEFEIVYEDKVPIIHSRKYVLSIPENSLREII